MKHRQQGFTLIEIVIAFTILTMATVLVVNIIAQSSTRVSKVNETLVAMNTLESAVAVLRSEIGHNKIRETYRGAQDGEYQWVAKVIDKANPDQKGVKQYLNLYQVRIQVFHDGERPRLELTTIIADR